MGDVAFTHIAKKETTSTILSSNQNKSSASFLSLGSLYHVLTVLGIFQPHVEKIVRNNITGTDYDDENDYDHHNR